MWPLDKKIVPLVEAVNSLDIRTIQSCQGHMKPWGGDSMVERFPWVLLYIPRFDAKTGLGSKRVNALMAQVARYNQSSNISWVVSYSIDAWSPMNRVPDLSYNHYPYLLANKSAASAGDLREVQKSIIELANFIRKS